jgi:hypothetical protein
MTRCGLQEQTSEQQKKKALRKPSAFSQQKLAELLLGSLECT